MLYLIHAYDNLYGGSHGLEDWSIVDCGSEEEASIIGEETSLEVVINSYSIIYDELEEQVIEYTEENMTEDDIEQLRSDIYDDDICYDIWKINNIENYDIEQLENILFNDTESFIEKYCES